MRKLFGFALVVVLAAGCKSSDSSSSSNAGSSDSTDQTSEANKPKGRSGKIELGPRRPSLPGQADDTAGSGEERRRERPSLADLDERRKARMQQFDTDGDGQISDDERKQARHKRAEDMHKTADKNGDGKVTPDELAEGNFRRMDPQSLDTNKDGDISTAELEAALENRTRAWGGGRFGRMDRGRRGSAAGSGSGEPN